MIRRIIRPALLCLLFFPTLPIDPVLAQGPDDPFYRWDLEYYRLTRDPDAPTGGILPLPDPPAEERAPGLRSFGWKLLAARASHPVPEDEADGSMIEDGTRGRFDLDTLLPLPLGLRVGLAGRFLLGRGGESGGTWLERSLVRQTTHTELRAGLTRSFWGDGFEGSLLLDRTAPPLEMLRFRSVRPWILPATRGIGRLHASLFVAYLDDGRRTIPDPLLAGSRVEWEPSGWARFSASRTILLGGAGRTQKLNARDIWDIWWARNENLKGLRDFRDTDQKVSFGCELRLPVAEWTPRWIDGARVFLEYGGEDSFDGLLPTAVAHMAGFSVGARGWLVLGEMSETVDDANPWYTHIIYGPEAYRFRGFLIGHPMGTDGRSAHVRLWTPRWGNERAQFWWRRRGFDPGEEGLVDQRDAVGGSVLRDTGSGFVTELSAESFYPTLRSRPRPDPPVRWQVAIGLRWTLPAAWSR